MSLSGKSVKFDNWNYDEKEKVKLVAISKPYLRDGTYFVEAKFLPENDKMFERPFSDLTLLIRDGKYQDGVYLPEENENTVELNLQFPKEKRPELKCIPNSKYKSEQFDRFNFGFDYLGEFFVLPLEVLYRDVLAPDAEILNMLTSYDTRDGKILYKMNEERITFTISSDFPRKYVQDDDKIRHLAWLFTNPGIEKMLAQIFQNISDGKGICFDWGFDSLKITAVVQCQKNTNFIQRITHIKKRVSVAEIIIEDNREIISDCGSGEEVSINRAVAKDGTELNANMGGNHVDMTNWNPARVEVEYEEIPQINRVKYESNNLKRTTSYTDKTIFVGDGKRTTRDAGGIDNIPRVIFKQHTFVSDYQFADISSALAELENYQDIHSVQSYVSKLSLHVDVGAFRFLSNGISERHYLSGKVTFKDNREALVLDIQRENHKISTLLIVSRSIRDWDGVIHTIIKNMILESGKWPNEILNSLCNEYSLKIKRCNHTHTNSETKAKTIHDKIME